MKKKYKSYTAKKLKLPKRILFFAVCALIIFLFSIILGNHLQNKLETSEIDKTPIETSLPEEDIDISGGIKDGNAVHSDNNAEVKAAFLNITGNTEASDYKAEIDKLRFSGYNAVSFIVIRDNRLTYASAVAEEHSRLPASESVVSMEVLADALSYAKGLGLRASAVYTKSDDTILDSQIAGELATLGFSEIIIRGYENLLEKACGEITPCIDYLETIRGSAMGTAVSLSLSCDAYSYARNSYQIEKLFTYTEFLTIDFTTADEETVTKLCVDYSGSFSTYDLRPLIPGESSYADILTQNSINSYQYVSSIPTPADDTTTDEGL